MIKIVGTFSATRSHFCWHVFFKLGK